MAEEFSLRLSIDSSGAVQGSEETVRALNRVIASSEKVGGAAKGAFESIKESFFSLRHAVEAAGVAFLFEEIVKAVAADERALAQLDAVLRSTGRGAVDSAEGFKEYAEALSRTTTFSRSAVISAEAIVLQFDKISTQSVPRVLRAIADVSARLGFDLTASARLVGKALADPEEGFTLLTRTVGHFSEEEKGTIKALNDMGEAALAQEFILSKLEKQMGGAAAAAKDTLGGSIDRLKNAFEELLVKAGEGGLSGGVKELTSTLERLTHDEGAKLFFRDLGAAIGFVASALAKAAEGVKLFEDGIEILTSGHAIKSLREGEFEFRKPSLNPESFSDQVKIEEERKKQDLLRLARELPEGQFNKEFESGELGARLRALAAPREAALREQALKVIAAEPKEKVARFAAGGGTTEGGTAGLAETEDEATRKAKELTIQIAEINGGNKAVRDLYEQINKAEQEQLKLEEQANEEVHKMYEGLQREKDAREKTAEALRLSVSPTEAIAKEMEKINALAEEFPQILTADKLELIKKNVFEKFSKDGKDAFDDLKTAVEGFGRDFSRTLADALIEGKANFDDFGKGILKVLAEIAIQRAIVGPLVSGFTSLFPKAHGDVIENGHSLHHGMGYTAAYAAGGVVTGPTIFPFAGGVGLAGEAGPEAILPLRRLSGGDLGVKASGGGGTIVQVIDQRQAGPPPEVRQSQGPDGQQLVRVIVRDAVRQGIQQGDFDGALRQNFGLARAGAGR